MEQDNSKQSAGNKSNNSTNKSTTIDKNNGSKVTKAEPDVMVNLHFRDNRSYTLHVGRTNIFFSPNGIQKVPISITKHKDFKSVAHRFTITGVKNG